MGRENATNTAISHASEKTHTGTVVAPGMHVFDSLCACNDGQYQDCLRNHPNDELVSTKQLKKLV